MKVVHITTEDIYGAGRAAERISESLKLIGIKSTVCVLKKGNASKNILIELTGIEKVKRHLSWQLNKNRMAEQFHAEKYGIIYHSLSEILREADLIHLHWGNNGFWSHSFFEYLARLGKPVIWTLHDMWVFTGGCHYNGNCSGYLSGCQTCPYIERGIKKNIPQREMEYKKKIYKKLNIRFIGCSRWITQECIRSNVSSSEKCICIPNPLEQRWFHSYDKAVSRNILQIDSDKQMILFGAGFNLDQRKGYQYLKTALENLDREKYCIGIFGGGISENELEGFEQYAFGYIIDNLHLALIYSAADVFVAPSIQENLANTVMEALGCGIPVVAFDIGGMPDLIENGKNGYLTTAFSASELSENIKEAMKLEGRKIISENAAEKFNEYRIAKEYLKVYQSALLNVD